MKEGKLRYKGDGGDGDHVKRKIDSGRRDKKGGQWEKR